MLGRMVSRSFSPISKLKSKNKLERIHTDLCGPMSVLSKGKKLYFMTFTDDFTRRAFVYFIRLKSEAKQKIQEFVEVMENQTGVRVKKIRSDRGGEFLAGSVQEFFNEKGIIHEKTASYHPHQNGVAERINRTLCEKARSMLYFHNVERQYWA